MKRFRESVENILAKNLQIDYMFSSMMTLGLEFRIKNSESSASSATGIGDDLI